MTSFLFKGAKKFSRKLYLKKVLLKSLLTLTTLNCSVTIKTKIFENLNYVQLNLFSMLLGISDYFFLKYTMLT